MVDETILERIINGDEDPKDLPLALLQSITNDFSQDRKIGQGGFGVVYKGELRNGIIVAVKRMFVNEHTVDDVSFRREVNSLMKINHQNVVRFLGFCSHAYHKSIKEAGSTDLNFVNVRERLLCLEYINNGSLDKHITDELRGLEWKTRYEIIMGICKGLCYLHEEKEIVHMDLKPANILLDDRMVPTITDFGLSRPNGNSHTMGQRFGTRGYLAPEYENAGKTSVKSDIYSLGAIIIELVTGCIGGPDENNVLRRWRHRWNKPPMLLHYHQVTRCINIAVRCRQQEPGHRPSISEIINTLSEPGRANEHTGQKSTYIEDDMLGIEPLELHFTFKPNKEMSWSVRLTNKTKACFAFNIENPSKHYTIHPDKGIVTPGCNDYLVKITSQRQEWAPQQVIENADKFIVRSTKVTEDLRGEDITRYIFHGEVPGKVVDEVDLMVVYEKGSRKRGQDPNVTVEAVPPKRKAINSSSYEDGTRGQLDRRNYHLPKNFSHRQPTNKTYLPRVSDRAMDVTRGAMGSLLHKLGELLKEEFNLETSVKEDIGSLSEELMKMHVVLHKMSEVQHDNLDDLVKHWSGNVREMSYNLEDFVDGFLVHNEPESNNSRFTELTHEMCLLLGKGKSHLPVGSLIKHHITEQVQDEAKNHKEYNVDSVVADATATVTDTIDPRMLIVFQDQKALVGIQEPRDDLIKRLSQVDRDVSEQQLGIFSIYGPGGLGKTTLVKEVYNELKGNFHLMAFVSVGRNPDKKQVLHDILAELDNNSSRGTLNEKQLIKDLHTLLKKKRYFIVIDDIWDSWAWGIIKCAFPENNLGSRVVTTTRIHSVAVVCCNGCRKNVCKMETLRDIDSRRLFVTRVFGMEDACPDVPEDILTVILKKCGGLPLAIISIASLVAKDPTTWSTWDYVRNSLVALFEGDNPTLTDMEQILDLSYRHLPDHLKTCLLHVCMHPEDREIDKNDLLRQWVAEGFVVSPNGWLDAEDVAESYFKELINMCMIQPGRIGYYSNEVLSCRVHDIILDLLRSKSADENFSHVADGSRTWAHGEIRRISVHCNDKEDSAIFETIKGSLSHARSALFDYVSPVPYLPVFKYVRVLHILLRNQDLDVTGITRLFLLRYLNINLVWNKAKLPDQIGELQHLETIDLKGCTVENYPSDIVSLPWLSHLVYGYGCGIVLPEGFERLKSLRTLEGIHLDKSSAENIKVLGKLTNLRKLQIFLEELMKLEEANIAMHMDALHSSISKLSCSLRILSLGGDDFYFGPFAYSPRNILDVPRGWSSMTLFPDGSAIRELDLCCCRFERCPGWISQLSNLHKFSVTVREVADGFSLVSGLSSLAFFWLMICGVKLEEQKEESVVIPGGGAFKALKEFFFGCPKAALAFEPGAMPKLEKLVMWFRYEMTPQFLPVGIQHLPAPTLEEIWLCLKEGSMEVKVKGSEDWDDYKTKHDRKLKAMLKKAFQKHHRGADIYVYFAGHGSEHLEEYSDEEYYEEDDNKEEDDEEYYFTEEDDESVDDEEHYSTEEDDEGAYQVNMSKTSAQVHADHTRQLVQLIEEQQDSGGTAEPQAGAAYQVNGSPTLAQVQANIRQLVQLIETHQDSGRKSINTDARPMVDILAHPAVRLPGWQSRRDQAFVISDALQLSFTAPLAPSPSSLHLTPYSSPNRAERMANFHFDINNDLSVERSI